MDLRVAQNCPQCGGEIPLSETARVLLCPWCGVKSFLQSEGVFRYVLPLPKHSQEKGTLLHAPYIRFKGSVFVVSGTEIRHKIIDTSQLGCNLPGLPPSLGLRPQAMPLRRLLPETGGRYLRLSGKAQVILERAANLSTLRTVKRRERVSYDDAGMPTVHTSYEVDDGGRDNFYHRAFIGETISFLYLPLRLHDDKLMDGITGGVLAALEEMAGVQLKGSPFNRRWRVGFQATLCPRCGWNLEGEADCLVMTCANCDTAWELTGQGLAPVDWRIVAGDADTVLYLGFWKITAGVDELGITSFADFLGRTNQPVVVRREWHERAMAFWVPAFKLQPKLFLKAGRQVCLNQHRFHVASGRMRKDFSPVTLPSSEARQALKISLAACATSPKQIFPHLPALHFPEQNIHLVYLPFSNYGHDLVQLHTGTVIPRTTLRHGRSL